MYICGLNKLTLLDYPKKVAATIFLGGCNLSCPFCQNSRLVFHPEQESKFSLNEILAFLKKRQGILDGVCISGGEPTLSPELPELLQQIRSLDYLIKLDTNGTRPDVLKDLYKHDLIQMVAMDIKSSPDSYHKVCGNPSLSLAPIEESIDFLLHGTMDYEFRTTVVRELHSEENFVRIGQWIKGAKAYYLQAYKDSSEVIHPGYNSYTLPELKHFKDLLTPFISHVGIRGID